MDILSSLGLITSTEWLTIGLVLFAAAQVGLQARQERQRRLERRKDLDESADRAFQYAWAEHFRLEGLADRMRRDDLIEMALLGVLKPSDVLPHEWGELTRALSTLGREAGYLGGVAAALCHDVERAIGIFVGSVETFAGEAPGGFTGAQKVVWIRKEHGSDLEPWEKSIRQQVQELSYLLWDAAKHNPRARIDVELDFQDDLVSEFARTAVQSLAKRAARDPAASPPPPAKLPPVAE